MHHFKKLDVWKESMDLAEMIYNLTSRLPANEQYGLVSQLKRSAISIPSNISEGAGRNSNKEFAQFLGIALGSAFELETQIILSKRLFNIDDEKINMIEQKIEQVSKMIYSLKKHLNSN